jgi:ABC-type transport system involved in multi-copper enzyme maturation permease subunit
MAAGLEIALLYAGRIGFGGHLRLLPAVYLVFLSLALVTALALLFSTFSTPALSALFAFFLWIAGHFGKDLQAFGEITKSASTKWFCNVLYYVIPNFANFSVDSRNIIQDGAYYQPMNLYSIAGATFYCILYCAVVISISVSIFMRRDFK